jgi:hypothetical protein
MADEQQPPDQPREPAGHPDRTGADETRQMPAAGADETRKIPREGDTEAPPAESRWSGRAGVPPPEAFVVPEAAATEEDMAAGRRWWLPVVLALVALVLLALLGVGLWLVMRGNDDPAPSTPVTPALTPSATPAQPSPSTPSTPDTSSAATTAAPSLSVAAQVVVPRLVGVDGDTARSILDALGLTPRLSARPDPLARPGTVLETDPAEGSMVPAGTQVTLVVAAAPPSPAPPSPPVPSPPPPTPSR